MAAVEALMDTDVRDALSSITAPTLVMHTTNDRVWPIEGARYIAEHITDARLVELGERPRTDVVGPLIPGRIVVIEEFVTGVRPIPVVDRVLKTVLFTDIVGSTERAAQLGDRRWRELLDAHDATIRTVLDEHRGEEINTTGDGFLVSFDGPARAIRCAQGIAAAGRGIGIEVRAGIHTGECERRGDDLSGIAVHIGARVAALAAGGEVLVTGTVRDLVAGSGIEFDDRGRESSRVCPASGRCWRSALAADEPVDEATEAAGDRRVERVGARKRLAGLGRVVVRDGERGGDRAVRGGELTGAIAPGGVERAAEQVGQLAASRARRSPAACRCPRRGPDPQACRALRRWR